MLLACPVVGLRANTQHPRGQPAKAARPSAHRSVGGLLSLAPHQAPNRQGGTRGTALRAAKQLYQPASAKDAVNTGLKAFNEEKDYVEAARLFSRAMELKPNDDEARAALYNLGCAYTKLKQWKPAAEAITRAVNDHNLKFAVAVKDDDLRDLRERREWLDAVNNIKGGLSRQAKIDLRSEAKAPFRLARITAAGALLIGAGVGLIFTITRLIKSLQGGEGAPELSESLTNFAVNSGVAAAAVFVLLRDLKGKEKSLKQVGREEELSRLQLAITNEKVLPLLRFRGQVRPVILAGTKQFVDRALKEAEPQYLNLRDRGVSVIPVVVDEQPKAKDDPDAKIRALKREFQQQRDESKGFGGAAGKAAPAAADRVEGEKPTEGGEAAAVEKAAVMGGLVDADKKWRLEPYNLQEWKDWVVQQRDFANLAAEGKDCWIQVQLDGTVRASGLGLPNWNKLVEELPLMNSLKTRFGDGVGPSV